MTGSQTPGRGGALESAREETPGPARLVNAADLGTAVEVAQVCGVARQTVYAWQHCPPPGYPAPVAVVGAKMRIWAMSEIRAWHAARPAPAPPEHGDWRRYQRPLRCRCVNCRAGWAAHMRDYWKSRGMAS